MTEEKQKQEEQVEKTEEKETLSKKQIVDWKSKHGKIYKTTIGDDVYIWRKIKRKEYVDIMAKEAGATDQERIYNRQDEIAKAVTIYPENFPEIMEENAGVASTIADEALAKSGFDIPSTEEL